MILVWGFKALYKTLGEGTFFCPSEGGDRPYRERQARKWFTLFWIPIIPLSVLGDFVECTSCKSSYNNTVLTAPTSAQIMDNLANAARQAIVSIITADGVIDDDEIDVALQVMKTYADTPYTRQHLDDDLASLKGGDLATGLRSVAGTLNDHGKESLLTACLRIAASDGSIDESELVEIRKAGTALGMSPAHIRGVVDHAKEDLLG